MNRPGNELTPETGGKMLHIHPRTVRYWISGKTLIPYSAYRLLRILTVVT